MALRELFGRLILRKRGLLFRIIRSRSHGVVLCGIPTLFVHRLVYSRRRERRIGLLLRCLPINVRGRVTMVVTGHGFLRDFKIVRASGCTEHATALRARQGTIGREGRVGRRVRIQREDTVGRRTISLATRCTLTGRFLVTQRGRVGTFNRHGERFVKVLLFRATSVTCATTFLHTALRRKASGTFNETRIRTVLNGSDPRFFFVGASFQLCR